MSRILLVYLFFVNIGHSLAKDADVVALVLARGGSKGIPLKNLVKLEDKSLLKRTLETITATGVFKEIWVSTDHPLIAEEALRCNASVHIRPDCVSRDETASIDSVVEFLSKRPAISKLALVQCTSPFILPEYLKEAFSLFQRNSECVFSVRRTYEFRWKEDQSGNIVPLNLDPVNRPRRQDWKGELVENGMFYFANRQLIMDVHSFQSNSCSVVEVPLQDSMQIDSPADLEMAELILRNRRQRSP